MKKNFVMLDIVSGAKSSAIIYSLVETAKANNLNVYEYIKYLLRKYLTTWMTQIPDFVRNYFPGQIAFRRNVIRKNDQPPVRRI